MRDEGAQGRVDAHIDVLYSLALLCAQCPVRRHHGLANDRVVLPNDLLRVGAKEHKQLNNATDGPAGVGWGLGEGVHMQGTVSHREKKTACLSASIFLLAGTSSTVQSGPLLNH
jgi:hypothetical protein